MDTNQSDPYRLYTRGETAEFLRCNVSYVTELTSTGRLGSVRIGKRVLVPRAYLEQFIRGEPAADTDQAWPPTTSLFGPAADTPESSEPT
jgi:excisionase family DNA binding protein